MTSSGHIAAQPRTLRRRDRTLRLTLHPWWVLSTGKTGRVLYHLRLGTRDRFYASRRAR